MFVIISCIVIYTYVNLFLYIDSNTQENMHEYFGNAHSLYHKKTFLTLLIVALFIIINEPVILVQVCLVRGWVFAAAAHSASACRLCMSFTGMLTCS